MWKKLSTEGMGKVAGGGLEVKYVGPSGIPFIDEREAFFAVVDADTGAWVNWDGMQYPAGTYVVRVPIEMAAGMIRDAKEHIAQGYNGPFDTFYGYEWGTLFPAERHIVTVEPSTVQHAYLH